MIFSEKSDTLTLAWKKDKILRQEFKFFHSLGLRCESHRWRDRRLQWHEGAQSSGQWGWEEKEEEGHPVLSEQGPEEHCSGWRQGDPAGWLGNHSYGPLPALCEDAAPRRLPLCPVRRHLWDQRNKEGGSGLHLLVWTHAHDARQEGCDTHDDVLNVFLFFSSLPFWRAGLQTVLHWRARWSMPAQKMPSRENLKVNGCLG